MVLLLLLRKRTDEHKALKTVVPSSSWKRATEDEKFRFAGHAATLQNGVAFSLNLSPKQQAKLKKHKDPLRAFTDTLNRELKKQNLSGIPYALSLEDSKKDKLHVHGFMVPPSGSLEALKAAIRAAGGLFDKSAATRQLTVKPLFGGAGWAFYCQKDTIRTGKKLEGEPRLFLSRSMTKISREFSGQ